MTNPYRAMCAEIADVRALLAQPVAEGPTDDELMDTARATDLVYYMGKGCGFASPYQEGTDITAEVLAFARAVLARWGNPTPQPPVDGEVAAALIELKSTVMGLDQMKMYVAAQRVKRAADLLERQHPQPVAVSERLPGPEDCDAEGRCWLEFEGSDDYEPCWTLRKMYGIPFNTTHWLSANALPIPEATND